MATECPSPKVLCTASVCCAGESQLDGRGNTLVTLFMVGIGGLIALMALLLYIAGDPLDQLD